MDSNKQAQIEEAQAIRAEAKAMLEMFGVKASSISMEDAGLLYKQMLAKEASRLAREFSEALGLIAIASRPSKAEAVKCYLELLEAANKTNTTFGSELIKALFDEEKKHTEEKLDILVKTALSVDNG